MKFSKRTIEILNNFITINDSIIFKEGNTIATKAIQGNVIAKADIAETFEQDFAIYNLAEFLNVISLFDDPDIEFDGNMCTISEGAKRVIYAAGNKDIIKNKPPTKQSLPEWDLQFNLLNSDYKQIKKASAVLTQDMIAFMPNSKSELIARTFSDDVSNTATSNSFDTVISPDGTGDFKAIFPDASLVVMDADYAVSISFKGISQFKSGDITYWIALHSDSFQA